MPVELKVVQIVVHIEVAFFAFDYANRKIRTVVSNSFEVRAEIREYKAKLDGAGSVFEALYMAALDLVVDGVDYVLQRLNFLRHLYVSPFKGVHRKVHDFMHRVHKHVNFLLGTL